VAHLSHLHKHSLFHFQLCSSNWQDRIEIMGISVSCFLGFIRDNIKHSKYYYVFGVSFTLVLPSIYWHYLQLYLHIDKKYNAMLLLPICHAIIGTLCTNILVVITSYISYILGQREYMYISTSSYLWQFGFFCMFTVSLLFYLSFVSIFITWQFFLISLDWCCNTSFVLQWWNCDKLTCLRFLFK
jgi:hypothetical protein